MKKNNSRYTKPQSIIRYLRIYHGYSQMELARKCGLTAMDICRLECGRFGMAAYKAKRVSDFFGVSLDSLVHDNYAEVLPKLAERPHRTESLKEARYKKTKAMLETGHEGEAFVAELERKKLKGTVYEHGVNEAYADDPTAGFDIMSFATDGTPIFIEVKTTKNKEDDAFYMTANEYAFMIGCLESGCKYELHRVYGAAGDGMSLVVYTAQELMNFSFDINDYIVRCA